MASIDRNSDGSCIVKLTKAVMVDGEKVARVTVPRITGRHMFKMPVIGTGTPIGVVIEWASTVVLPKGAIEEMDPSDAIDVAGCLLEALGKSQPAGEPASP